jgi:uncharacterized protein involved in exopolysaccharide biosynthesis
MIAEQRVVVGQSAYPGATSLLTRNFWKLLLTFLLCGVAAFFLAALMRPAYRAEALVLPAHNANPGLLGGLVGGSALGALGLTQDVDKNEPIQVIASHSLLKRFIDKYSLLPILCDADAIKCKRLHGSEAIQQERKMNSAIALFQKHLLSVSENTITGVVHVSIIWYDRRLAADWCNDLIDLTNKLIQDRAEELAAMRVTYLQQEYAQTSVVPLQSAVNSILVNEMTKKMDAATRPEYAWRVVNRAYPPDDRYPAEPQKAVIAAVAGVGGTSLYALFIVYRERRRLGVGRL